MKSRKGTTLDKNPPILKRIKYRHQLLCSTVCKLNVSASDLPFIERILFGVALKTSFFDKEFHALVERSRYGRWLFAQQDVDGFGRRDAERRFLAVASGATIRVLAVQKTVFVVIFAIVAFQFQRDAAIRPFPALFAATAPPTSFSRFALASFGTVARAALQSAVLSVPAGNAKASAILALTVLVTSRIAESFLAEFARPSWVADASASLASSMSAAIDAAGRFGTIVARPTASANAFM